MTEFALTNPLPPSSARSARDAYWTPPSRTHALLDAVPEIRGRVWEPCAGAGWMANVLRTRCDVRASDICPQAPSIEEHDFLHPGPRERHDVDWVVTNPPFDLAIDVLRRALAVTPRVALLCRLSFVEYTQDRGPFLADNVWDRIIYLPRTRFVRGDGRPSGSGDSVIPAWFVWGVTPQKPVWGCVGE